MLMETAKMESVVTAPLAMRRPVADKITAVSPIANKINVEASPDA